MIFPRLWLWTLAFLMICGLNPAHAQNPVKWTATLSPTDVRAGEVARIEVKAQIAAPWYIYAPTTPPGGPIPATIELVANPKLKSAGKLTQSKAKRKRDAGFEMDVETFSKSALFTIPVKVSGAGRAIVRVRFQACNEKLCLPPKTVDVPLTFKVAPGSARPERLIVASSTNDSLTLSSTTASSTNARPNSGVWTLIATAFGAGLIALLTPCVFPMIPITVSVFSKTGGDSKPSLAGPIAYCAGIIGTFTLVGVAVALVFGAAGLSLFAANPIVNIALALLFIVLALNLFGVFEILVPPALMQRVQPNGKTGLLAPFLMGFAFTLTSFTCTVPFVGTTLVATATQGPLYPALGMLAFSTAFALPFFALALFPGWLSKMPRAGEWLVSTKAFMGFLELAAALKFLQTADYSLNLGLITRPVFLAIWFALALVAGAYLLRWLRLPNDSPNVKVGPLRRSLGIGTLGLAGWLLAANNGVSLRDLNAYLPPRDYGTKEANHGSWVKNDFAAAQARAKAENKPLLVNFTGYACTNCRLMENDVLPSSIVTGELENFVAVELFTDGTDAKSRENSQFQQKKFGTIAIPLYAVLTPDGKIQDRLEGLERNPEVFARFLSQARTGSRVAKR